MSWGYWGIVTGLLVLLALFFVCVEILYAAPLTTGVDKTDVPVGSPDQAALSTKHAA